MTFTLKPGEFALRSAAGREDTPGAEYFENDFSDNDLRDYSILRAMRKRLNGDKIDGLEGECHAHITKKSGREAKGLFVPTRALARGNRFMGAALTTSTGTGSIRTTVSRNYIEALIAATVLRSLGVTFMGGLQGTFGIPRSSGDQSYWASEGVAVTDGAITVDQVVLAPHTISARSDFTRQLIEQTSFNAEVFARETIFRTIAVGVEQGAIAGTGASGQPLGILNNTNCGLVTLATGASAATGAVPTNLTGSAMTWAAAVGLETLVSSANAVIDSGAYVTTKQALSYISGTPKASQGYFTPSSHGGARKGATNIKNWIAANGQMNGYNVATTGNIPSNNGSNSACTSMIFGNWSDLLIGEWGVLDLLMDPYSLSTSGGLRVVGMQDVDIELRHPQSFSRLYDIRTR